MSKRLPFFILACLFLLPGLTACSLSDVGHKFSELVEDKPQCTSMRTASPSQTEHPSTDSGTYTAVGNTSGQSEPSTAQPARKQFDNPIAKATGRDIPLLPPDAPSGSYTTRDGQMVRVSDDGGYRDSDGKIIMRKDSDGDYRDSDGKRIMRKGSEGDYRDSDGHLIMREDSNGDYRDSDGHLVMRKGSDGIYRDADGKRILQ